MLGRLFYTPLAIILSASAFGSELERFEEMQPIYSSNCLLSSANATSSTKIRRFKVKGDTFDRTGRSRLNSGVVYISENASSALDPIVYLHPTTSFKGVPSEDGFDGNYFACKVMESNLVVIAPDYFGPAADDMHHPYLIKSETVIATDHMIQMAEELLENNLGYSVKDEFIVTGYSQGGHAVMSYLESFEKKTGATKNIRFSASFSGPYDLSGFLIDRILRINGGENGTFFASLILANYQQYYNDQYAHVRDAFSSRALDVEKYAVAFDASEVKKRVPRKLNKLFNGDYLSDLKNNLSHPFRLRLAENSIKAFSASSKVFLGYSRADKSVPEGDTKALFQAMKSLGNDVSLIKTSNTKGHVTNFLSAVSAFKDLLISQGIIAK